LDLITGAAEAGALDEALRRARGAYAQGLGRGQAHRWRLLAAGVAVLAVICGAGLGSLMWRSAGRDAAPVVYAAEPGRRQVVILSDGSRAVLDGGGAITVAFTRHGRALDLTRGRAFFDVAHDAARPFEVTGQGHVVRALGTAFEVDLGAAGKPFRVALLRGRVQVRDARIAQAVELEPGQVLSLDRANRPRVERDDVDRETAWRDGRLELDDESLDKAVADLNTHGGRRIIVRGGAGRLKVTGVFSSDDPETFADAVAVLHGLVVRQGAEGAIVLALPRDAGEAAD
jgi:transmembrane sensor